ncbi:universal stress protein [Natrarchaeobaculum sulfurireducens]|uniref:Nucleotide-binding protein, UspA family n=1 Tax=Natrarchaeobaculum sulfurireducens TaxID=2044521 RepID=A0A346PFQ3_9EURY|nr:universal stress protein [Natrarchaeobaculum sulfurireducens]AXR78348.1 Nucleotide-binding protein, UspA family [Natrarchaeobaculum sulfurireducens]
MYDSILVATDGSNAASTAVEHAIELARRLEVPLYAIAVLESRTEYDNAIVDPEEVDRRRREQASSWLEHVETLAKKGGVGVETTIRSGVPDEEIRAYAGELGVGAIVLGAQGRSSFRRALLGSTADRVVRLADQPVVVVDSDTE